LRRNGPAIRNPAQMGDLRGAGSRAPSASADARSGLICMRAIARSTSPAGISPGGGHGRGHVRHHRRQEFCQRALAISIFFGRCGLSPPVLHSQARFRQCHQRLARALESSASLTRCVAGRGAPGFSPSANLETCEQDESFTKGAARRAAGIIVRVRPFPRLHVSAASPQRTGSFAV
jgi:hypothetical protein